MCNSLMNILLDNLLSLSLSLWRPGSSRSDLHNSLLPNSIIRFSIFGIRAVDPYSSTMAETRSNSQNSEKIAALSKVTDSHEQSLQEIQKQL